MPKPRTRKMFTTEPMQILRSTEKAFQVQPPDGNSEWLPKSQIREPDERDLELAIESGECFELLIPEWLAEEKGWV